LGGYAGGLGYAAAFGLLVIRRGAAAPHGVRGGRVVAGSVTARPPALGRPRPVLHACAACGQRSLTCYLGQSVLFVALLPAWTFGLGARLGVAQAALLAVGVWLVMLLVAVLSARAGHRGP